MTITSKLSPPGAFHRLTYIYQRRNGEQIEYHCGGTISSHERARECGGCNFCIGEISMKNTETGAEYGTSSPRFYRWPCEPCAECKPRCERLVEIDHMIYELDKEKKSLL